MSKIKILTDSTCDLTKEILERYNIDFLPLYVTVNNKTYKDIIEINTKEMYEIAEKSKSHPKTSTSSIQDMYDFFLKYLKEDYEIVYCGISKSLSSNYQNCLITTDLIYEKHPEYEGKIHLVDSKNLSTGISLTTLKMAQALEEGKSVEEIVELGNNNVDKVQAQFCIETFDYLHKGGRCSSTIKFVGQMLRIKPMIKVTNGKMDVYKKPIGSFKKALGIMIDEFIDNIDNIDKDFLFITHSEGDKYADYISEKIKEYTPLFKNVFITRAGCVISSHCGQNTIGILYTYK